MADLTPPFLRRIVLRNWKSIRECDISLGSLTLLVGLNGSGKSNFLDALGFVAESLRTTMDQALRERGGIKEVRRRSRGRPTHFAIELYLTLSQCREASFKFRVGAQPQGGFEVQEEECVVTGQDGTTSEYRIHEGQIERASFQPWPRASTDRLFLTIASGFSEFRGIFDLLAGMGFYSISPDQLRELQEPDAGRLLLRDGRNVASVIARIQQQHPHVKERIEQYLGRIAPGVTRVDKMSLRHKETLEFKQLVAGDPNPWSFPAQNMSDGTLRALGVLVSLFQCFDRPAEDPIPLVGIEEPEATLHPAAAVILMDALREASNYTQVLVTSHSPELLDNKDLDPDSLLIVDSHEGETAIAPADEATKSAMRDRLFTAGELLKLDQLKPQRTPAPLLETAAQDTNYPLFPNES